MRLYQYIFDGNEFYADFRIVKERPKSYALENGESFPVCFRSVINKKEIGVAIPCFQKLILFLDEDDRPKAREILIGERENRVSKLKAELEKYEQEIRILKGE